jgi:hypothetical protein
MGLLWGFESSDLINIAICVRLMKLGELHIAFKRELLFMVKKFMIFMRKALDE